MNYLLSRYNLVLGRGNSRKLHLHRLRRIRGRSSVLVGLRSQLSICHLVLEMSDSQPPVVPNSPSSSSGTVHIE